MGPLCGLRLGQYASLTLNNNNNKLSLVGKYKLNLVIVKGVGTLRRNYQKSHTIHVTFFDF